jgi:hypothetical protein
VALLGDPAHAAIDEEGTLAATLVPLFTIIS